MSHPNNRTFFRYIFYGFHTVFTSVLYNLNRKETGNAIIFIANDRKKGEAPVNSIRKFKNIMSILMLYAANMIVHDKNVIPTVIVAADTKKRITGTAFLKLTTSERS